MRIRRNYLVRRGVTPSLLYIENPKLLPEIEVLLGVEIAGPERLTKKLKDPPKLKPTKSSLKGVLLVSVIEGGSVPVTLPAIDGVLLKPPAGVNVETDALAAWLLTPGLN